VNKPVNGIHADYAGNFDAVVDNAGGQKLAMPEQFTRK